VVFDWTVTEVVTVSLSAVTSMLAVPFAVPLNVAEAAPFTKLVAPEMLPTAGVALTKLAGNDGSPLSSTVRSGPELRFLILALIVDELPEQIGFGLALACNCNQVKGATGPAVFRKSVVPGPELRPHQLSFAVVFVLTEKTEAPRGAEFPANRENVMTDVPLL
jgi:hypothetical protein